MHGEHFRNQSESRPQTNPGQASAEHMQVMCKLLAELGSFHYEPFYWKIIQVSQWPLHYTVKKDKVNG